MGGVGLGGPGGGIGDFGNFGDFTPEQHALNKLAYDKSNPNAGRGSGGGSGGNNPNPGCAVIGTIIVIFIWLFIRYC